MQLLAQTHRGMKSLLIISGVIWIGRTVLEIAFKPEYWNPRSAIDYVAVIGTSLALLTLALGIWGIGISQASHAQGRAVWKLGINLACLSALVVGLSNLLEDAFGVAVLGFLFPIGIVALSIGLLMSGVAALRIPQFHRSIGWLLLLCLAGVLFLEFGGGIVVGLSLLALAYTSGAPQYG